MNLSDHDFLRRGEEMPRQQENKETSLLHSPISYQLHIWVFFKIF